MPLRGAAARNRSVLVGCPYAGRRQGTVPFLWDAPTRGGGKEPFRLVPCTLLRAGATPCTRNDLCGPPSLVDHASAAINMRWWRIPGLPDAPAGRLYICSAVLGSRFSVLGSRFLVLGSWFLVLGSRFLVLGSRFSVLGSRFPVTALHRPRFRWRDRAPAVWR
jgi:hypothetical protein